MALSAALGGAVRRREDPRLVTGAGQYTDDVRRDGCLHAVFVRSTFAHARITNFDASAANSIKYPGRCSEATQIKDCIRSDRTRHYAPC